MLNSLACLKASDISEYYAGAKILRFIKREDYSIINNTIKVGRVINVGESKKQ